MCDPVSIVGVGLSVAGAVSGKSASDKAASSSKRAQRMQQAFANKTAAQAMGQNNAAAIEKKSARALEAIMERGRLRAGLGDTGLAGKGANQMYLQSLFNESTDVMAIERNRTNAETQIKLEREAGVAQTQANIAQIEANRPSALSMGLGLAGTALGYADRAGLFDPKRPKPNPYANRTRANFGHGGGTYP